MLPNNNEPKADENQDHVPVLRPNWKTVRAGKTSIEIKRRITLLQNQYNKIQKTTIDIQETELDVNEDFQGESSRILQKS